MIIEQKEKGMTMNSADLAKFYNLPIEETDNALINLEKGFSILLAASGKIGSGKDTIAPKIIEGLGFSKDLAVHNFFAKPLKDEMNSVISLIQVSEDSSSAIRLIEKELNTSTAGAKLVVDTLWEEVKVGLVKSSYDRTKASRLALQFWGTEVRRFEDENYWVKRSVSSSIKEIANGLPVFFTDARFPNEIKAVNDLSGVSVRLLVSPKVQEERIKNRDGVLITEEMRSHTSETALDTYEDFTTIVDTDLLSPEEVTTKAIKEITSKTVYKVEEK